MELVYKIQLAFHSTFSLHVQIIYPILFLQTIGASMMDLDAVKRLKTENLMETEMSMQHIWATEVEHINPLTQGRNVIQELIDG